MAASRKMRLRSGFNFRSPAGWDALSSVYEISMVPSPFPLEIYCDIIKSIVLEPYVTVDLSAERCIACRLRALASVH